MGENDLMQASIRKSVPDELERLRSLDHVTRVEPGRVNHIRQSIETGECWSICEADQVIGYIIINKSFFHQIFLDLIYIDENHRNRGVGRMAINWVKTQIGESFFTSTNESNARMIHLLQTEGFQDSGIVYNLDPGDPEIIFYFEGSRSSPGQTGTSAGGSDHT